MGLEMEMGMGTYMNMVFNKWIISLNIFFELIRLGETAV